MRTIYDLMVGVARKLSKKAVIVRIRKPATKGADGECHADQSGNVIIDVSPDFSDPTMLYIFLHEVAHAKNDRFLRSNVWELSEQSVSDDPGIRTAGYDLKEGRAEKVAREWIAYAEKNANPEFDYFEGCLLALYRKGDK